MTGHSLLAAALLATQLAAPPPPKEPAPGGTILPLPEAQPAPEAVRWAGSDRVIDRLAAEVERAAERRDPRLLGLLYRLWNYDHLVDHPERVAQAVAKVLGARGIAPLAKAHAAYLAAQLARTRGDEETARVLLDEVGLIRDAMVIGPFDNSAGQGHEARTPVEDGGRLDQPVDGKVRPVTWRHVKGLSPHGVLELSQLVSPSAEASAYVAVVVEADAPTPAAIRTGSVDQLRVFLGSRLLGSVDTRRFANLDQDAFPALLPRGRSLLLLKSSWTERSGRLLFRLTAPDGRPLKGVRVLADPGPVAEAFAKLSSTRIAAPKHRVTGVRDALDRLAERTKGRARADVLALRSDLMAILGLFDTRKLPTPPERDLEAAIRLAPDDPSLRFFFAHRVSERDPALAREQLEAALKSDPGFAPALLELGMMAQSSGRLVEARRRLAAAVGADPRLMAAHVSLAVLGFDELEEGAAAILRLKRAPGLDRSSSGLVELARMQRSAGDKTGAFETAERAITLDHQNSLARHLAIGMALDRGDTERALEHVEAALRNRPWVLRNRIKRARILAGMKGRLPEAIGVMKEAAETFPDDPAAASFLAELLLFAGERTRALAELDRSLALDPHQPQVRRHRRALSGERRELEDEFSADALALSKHPVSDDERRWGAAYLADRGAIRLYPNGKSTQFRQWVFRLQNPRLKDDLRTHRIHYSPTREIVDVLSAERIRPTGEIIQASRISDEGTGGKVSGMYVDQRFKTIVFDDLDEGDVINIRYRVESVGHNMFGGFFGEIEALQSVLPKQDVRFTVIAPKSIPLYSAGIRAGPPVRSERGDDAILSWSFDHIDALELEPFAPPYPDIGMLVSVTTYENWSDLGRWYAGLFREQMELDEPARKAAKAAIGGAKDERRIIERLYNYVVKNTRYVGIELGIHGWKPFKASEVHRRRYGDCKDKSTLLATMLRDNGIDAALTLVRTADRGRLPADHATMWAFNHAITYVPSLDLFLDPTAEFSGSKELPYQDQGAMALIVHPDGRTRLTTLPTSTAEDNLNRSSYQATFERDGAVMLEGVERFFGARASSLRDQFEEIEHRKRQLEAQLGEVFAGVRVEKLAFSDLANLEAPVEYRYNAVVPRYGTVEDGSLTIPVALFQHQVAGAYAKLAERRTTLTISHPWSTQNVVEYRLPRSAKVVKLPEGLTIESKHISLVQQVRRTEHGFIADDVVTMSSKEVPAEDYPEFRETCLAIDRALARKVVIAW